MNSISSGFRILGVAAAVLVFGALQIAAAQVQPAAQGQAAAPVAGAAQSTFCGSQPLCYETADFAATVTDFRTSMSGGLRLIDVGMRFQNKTNQPLILGYLVNSGTALDDRGNRYGVWGPNGFRGIGAAYGGNNFDPKFNIRAGSYADAQFELAWNPGQTPYGLTFELNLSVDEINTIEASQHTLGGEFPLHYRGLVNGVSSAAPAQATAFNPQGAVPCSPTGTAVAGAANSAGGQTAAGANTAVSNAAAAISNFGSLFGKKKAVAPAAPSAGATTTAGGVPCAPAVNGSSLASGASMTGGTSTGTSMSAVNTTGTQTTSGTSATTATNTATQRTATMTATQKAATTPTAKPVLTNAAKVTPVPPANSAVKKTAVPPAPAKPVSQ